MSDVHRLKNEMIIIYVAKRGFKPPFRAHPPRGLGGTLRAYAVLISTPRPMFHCSVYHGRQNRLKIPTVQLKITTQHPSPPSVTLGRGFLPLPLCGACPFVGTVVFVLNKLLSQKKNLDLGPTSGPAATTGCDGDGCRGCADARARTPSESISIRFCCVSRRSRPPDKWRLAAPRRRSAPRARPAPLLHGCPRTGAAGWA
jgi:hypothetical protein